jgi:hypothetical protein
VRCEIVPWDPSPKRITGASAGAESTKQLPAGPIAKSRLKGLGKERRHVRTELSDIRLVDVVLTSRTGIEIRRRRVSRVAVSPAGRRLPGAFPLLFIVT